VRRHRLARRQRHCDQHGRQRRAWRDNVFVERLWRSVKYEKVYLNAYQGVSEARASIGRYFDFYNGRRPHSSLDGMTPDQAYFSPLPLRLAA
jgi:transposase InsO family protein